jgi:hypothetical protein
VVINDTDIINGILNRVVGPLETNKYARIYVLKFKTQVAKDAWLNDSGFDYPNLVSLATLPKEKLNKYYGSGSGNSYYSAKHQSKEFEFSPKGAVNQYGRYVRNKNSDFWTTCEVDLENDEGVYVEIDRFEPWKANRTGYVSPQDLAGLLESITAAGITLPEKLYGFKKASAELVAKNPEMVNFWVWLGGAIREYFQNNPKVLQDYINREYCITKMNLMHSDLPTLSKVVTSWKSIPATSALIEFFAKVNLVAKYDDHKLSQLKDLMVRYTTYRPTGTPSHDVQNDYLKLLKKYPLLFNTAKNVGAYNLSKADWNQPLEEYVTMVDLVSP